MTDHPEADLQDRLWEETKKARYGMLGLVNRSPSQHFQPMTAFGERHNSQIWFFTRDDTDLAKAVGQGGEAMFIIQAKDQGFQACMGGTLTQAQDRQRIEQYWNPVVAAWYPAGKDDPHLTLLKLDLSDAQVWVSETNPVTFGLKIAKANMTHSMPDVGESAAVDLKA